MSDRALTPNRPLLHVSWRTTLAVLGILSFAWALMVNREWSFGGVGVLTSDTALYHDLIEKAVGGSLPYFDLGFEHFPLMLVPMAGALIVSTVAGLHYTVGFAAVMLVLLFLIGETVARLGRRLGIEDGARRWLLVAGPLFPLVLFRLDAVPTLLAVLALYLAVTERERGSIAATFGGILAKGWPVVLAATEWWRGRRGRAVGYVAFTGILGLSLLATPGFREGRQFVGVHMETLTGSLLVTWRLLTGTPTGIVGTAGATYVEAGTWATIANALVGLGIGLTALLVLRTKFDWLGAVALTGVLTFAMMFASPLLSAQFLIWPTPFLALAATRRVRWLAATAALLTTLLFSVWTYDALWWNLGLVARNLLLLGAAVAFTAGLVNTRDQSSSDSRKNLPV